MTYQIIIRIIDIDSIFHSDLLITTDIMILGCQIHGIMDITLIIAILITAQAGILDLAGVILTMATHIITITITITILTMDIILTTPTIITTITILLIIMLLMEGEKGLQISPLQLLEENL